MIPKTLSASSLQVAESCLARWAAEYFNRASGMSGKAADVGTSVHGALELYVKAVHMDKSHDPDLQLIIDLYKMSYMQTFDSANFETPEFADGLQMTKDWWKRTSFEGFDVISAEKKDFFPVRTSVGEIPFNYIWDRFDRLGPRSYRVVDYKTIRLPITPTGLKEKIQPRCYGLAAAIQLKAQGIEYDEIWIQFDLLRYDTVGCVFTHEDNVATWNYLKKSAERIIAADEANPPEKLNPDCRYCVRKHNCPTLRKNVMVGGVFGITDVNEAVERKAQVQYAMKALESIDGELDQIILQHAERTETLEWETDTTKVNIGVRGTRKIDAERAGRIIGPELMLKYGAMNIGSVDKLLKGDEITEEQKQQLKALIGKNYSEPGVKIAPVSPVGD